MNRDNIMKQFFMLAMLFVVTMIVTKNAAADHGHVDCDKIRTDEHMCVACNIYHESHTEPRLGQFAVAAVTLNRVDSPNFPNSFCDVVWQEFRTSSGKRIAQFSWTLDGEPDIPKSHRGWKRALKIADFFAVRMEKATKMCPEIAATLKMRQYVKEQYGFEMDYEPVTCSALETILKLKWAIARELDPTEGALYYHADYVEPRWSYVKQFAVQIARHIFYYESEKIEKTLASQ